MTDDEIAHKNLAFKAYKESFILVVKTLNACCTTCDKTLTADEVKYLEDTCNDCESKVDWYSEDTNKTQ